MLQSERPHTIHLHSKGPQRFMFSTCRTTVIGSAFAAVGVASCAWVKDITAAMLAGGVVAILVAAMFVMTCWIVRTIKAVNRPADQAYELGYEMGYNKGWHEARRHDRPRLVTGLRAEAGG